VPLRIYSLIHPQTALCRAGHDISESNVSLAELGTTCWAHSSARHHILWSADLYKLWLLLSCCRGESAFAVFHSQRFWVILVVLNGDSGCRWWHLRGRLTAQIGWIGLKVWQLLDAFIVWTEWTHTMAQNNKQCHLCHLSLLIVISIIIISCWKLSLHAGVPLGLLLSTSLRHVVCFYGWINTSSALLYALGTLHLPQFSLSDFVRLYTPMNCTWTVAVALLCVCLSVCCTCDEMTNVVVEWNSLYHLVAVSLSKVMTALVTF